MLLSLFISTAWPCAGLIHEDGALADSDAQEVIFGTTGDTVTVSYNVHYEGTAENFGWIIPIFGEFQSMVDGDVAVFDALRDLTQPQVDYVPEESSGGGGCGCGSSKTLGGARGDTADLSNGVDVVAEGFTGTYAYTVVSTGSADDFLTWVSDNGWALHDSDLSVGEYAEEGGVQFILINLAAGEGSGTTPEEGRLLPPVVIQYSGDTMRFPAKMARYGMMDQVRTSVYVQGEQRASIESGWTATEVGTLREEPASSAEDVYDRRLLELGGDNPGYGVVWAGESGGVWVTRFDTLVNKEANTVDPVFALDGGTEAVETLIELGYFDDESSSEAWLILPLMGLGFSAIRRRRA